MLESVDFIRHPVQNLPKAVVRIHKARDSQDYTTPADKTHSQRPQMKAATRHAGQIYSAGMFLVTLRI